MNNVYGYIKVLKTNKGTDYSSIFYEYNCKRIIMDDSTQPKADGSIWSSLKQTLVSENAKLMIDSIDSLGKTSREIYKELNWIQDNRVRLYIISMPSTFSDDSDFLTVLCELYYYKAEKERNNVLTGQKNGQELARANNIRTGRPAAQYPELWKDYYSMWQNGKITAVEFMNSVNLKKGTFYNLVKRYKAEIEQIERYSNNQVG